MSALAEDARASGYIAPCLKAFAAQERLGLSSWVGAAVEAWPSGVDPYEQHESQCLGLIQRHASPRPMIELQYSGKSANKPQLVLTSQTQLVLLCHLLNFRC